MRISPVGIIRKMKPCRLQKGSHQARLLLHIAIEGFFNIPVINCSARELFAHKIKELGREDMVAVAPDMGGAKRARQLAVLLDAPVVILEKYRPPNDPDNF